MTVPQYGALQNKANQEYRTNKATEMSRDYKQPECLFEFQKQDEGQYKGKYGIKNLKNNEYFQCTITKMNSAVQGSCQLWELVEVDNKENENQYYIKNVNNGEYMTKKASQLSGNAGSDEVYIIEEKPKV